MSDYDQSYGDDGPAYGDDGPAYGDEGPAYGDAGPEGYAEEQAYGDEGAYGEGYDAAAYDDQGYQQEGYGQEGYDQQAYDEPGYDQQAYDQEGGDQQGYDQAQADGEAGAAGGAPARPPKRKRKLNKRKVAIAAGVLLLVGGGGFGAYTFLAGGSDPIGTAQLSLPPARLFRQFQDSMRLIYLTGQNDQDHLDMDTRSQQSLHEWCVFHLDTVSAPWSGHEVVAPGPLSHALDLLDKPAQPDPGKLADCRARIDKHLTEQLQQTESLLANGKPDKARSLLDKIDIRYGGLAAPRSIQLAEKISAPH